MKKQFLVYLAGPISGVSYEDSVGWREYAVARFQPYIAALSPLRAKKYLSGIKEIPTFFGADYTGLYSPTPLSTPQGIFCRDYNDCTRADAILVNLLGSTKVSIGTVMEIAWAHSARTPVIAVMEPNNPHDHPMIRQAMPFIVPTVDEGIELVKAILLPESHQLDL